MARQSRADDVMDALEGLRTRIARAVGDAAGAGRSGASSSQKRVQGVIDDLRKLADELESRIPGRSTSRTEAAKKAARTRASNARKRSTTAKKAAATRKRTASSSPTRKAASTTRKAASTTRKAASTATRKATGGTRKATGGTRKASSSGGTRKKSSSSGGTRRRSSTSRAKKS